MDHGGSVQQLPWDPGEDEGVGGEGGGRGDFRLRAKKVQAQGGNGGKPPIILNTTAIPRREFGRLKLINFYVGGIV